MNIRSNGEGSKLLKDVRILIWRVAQHMWSSLEESIEEALLGYSSYLNHVLIHNIVLLFCVLPQRQIFSLLFKGNNVSVLIFRFRFIR
jgi:hypothetical protein